MAKGQMLPRFRTRVRICWKSVFMCSDTPLLALDSPAESPRDQPATIASAVANMPTNWKDVVIRLLGRPSPLRFSRGSTFKTTAVAWLDLLPRHSAGRASTPVGNIFLKVKLLIIPSFLR